MGHLERFNPAIRALAGVVTQPRFIECHRLAPFTDETKSGATNQISVENLYLDEADQGAFIVASTRHEATQARVTLTRPTRQDGVAFGGNIVLREVISTGSVNGEMVPDALPALDNAGLIMIPAHRSVVAGEVRRTDCAARTDGATMANVPNRIRDLRM